MRDGEPAAIQILDFSSHQSKSAWSMIKDDGSCSFLATGGVQTSHPWFAHTAEKSLKGTGTPASGPPTREQGRAATGESWYHIFGFDMNQDYVDKELGSAQPLPLLSKGGRINSPSSEGARMKCQAAAIMQGLFPSADSTQLLGRAAGDIVVSAFQKLIESDRGRNSCVIYRCTHFYFTPDAHHTHLFFGSNKQAVSSVLLPSSKIHQQPGRQRGTREGQDEACCLTYKPLPLQFETR